MTDDPVLLARDLAAVAAEMDSRGLHYGPGIRRAGHVHHNGSRGLTTVHTGSTPYALCADCWRAWVEGDREVSR